MSAGAIHHFPHGGGGCLLNYLGGDFGMPLLGISTRAIGFRRGGCVKSTPFRGPRRLRKKCHAACMQEAAEKKGGNCSFLIKIIPPQKTTNLHGHGGAGDADMVQSESDDDGGDYGGWPGLQPCYIGRVPDDIWKRLALFLAWCDAASLYAGSRPVRDLMRGKWSPHSTVTTERSALAAAAADDSWQDLCWDGANPVGVKTVIVAPGTNNNAALVQQIQLYHRGLHGV